MILFKPEHVHPILEGRKTETRRLGKKRWNVDAIHQCRTRLFGQPFAKVRILEVRREPLGALNNDDARAEGYESREAYREVWERIYGSWDANQLVWVVRFELVSPYLHKPGISGPRLCIVPPDALRGETGRGPL